MKEELGPLLDEQCDPMAVPVAGIRIAFAQAGEFRTHIFVAELDAVRMVVTFRAARNAEHGTAPVALRAPLEELEDAAGGCLAHREILTDFVCRVRSRLWTETLPVP